MTNAHLTIFEHRFDAIGNEIESASLDSSDSGRFEIIPIRSRGGWLRDAIDEWYEAEEAA